MNRDIERLLINIPSFMQFIFQRRIDFESMLNRRTIFSRTEITHQWKCEAKLRRQAKKKEIKLLIARRRKPHFLHSSMGIFTVSQFTAKPMNHCRSLLHRFVQHTGKCTCSVMNAFDITHSHRVQNECNESMKLRHFKWIKLHSPRLFFVLKNQNEWTNSS